MPEFLYTPSEKEGLRGPKQTNRKKMRLLLYILIVIFVAQFCFVFRGFFYQTGLLFQHNVTNEFYRIRNHIFGWKNRGKCPDCNLVLIIVDTLRADHTNLCGYNRTTTPVLDNFYSGKAVFLQAISPSPCTIPAVRQIMTSSMNAKGVPLAEILSQNGYTTSAFVGNPYLDIDIEGRGFQHAVIKGNTDPPSDEEITYGAIQWLQEYGLDNKFFLWLHYMGPHDPYAPPKEFRRWKSHVGEVSDGDIRKILKKDAEPEPFWSWFKGRGLFSKEDVEQIVSLYDSDIRYIDSQIGEVLDQLAKLGLMKKTIVVFTSDHGESLGEDDYWTHCNTLRNVEIRVPLAINMDASVIGVEGLANMPVSTMDIYPSALGWLGLLYESRLVEGMPFSDRISYTHYNQVFSEFDVKLPIHQYKIIVRSGKWKLFFEKHKRVMVSKALYDVNSDPYENKDISLSHSQIINVLEQNMEEKYLIIDNVEVEIRKTQEKLRALGYL